ncbi:hypothetical protein EW146_g9277 [Bondarzewia mesenterica]|uniref:Uncharacterized protein n=1 Tax=Bondarzewia mesenterica TaxID=1095465 RepID=A0A4S4L7V2_9AGAM|nr:hypothetical protein EW146_g9277 [Bondarzewia mesenterica]
MPFDRTGLTTQRRSLGIPDQTYAVAGFRFPFTIYGRKTTYTYTYTYVRTGELTLSFPMDAVHLGERMHRRARAIVKLRTLLHQPNPSRRSRFRFFNSSIENAHTSDAATLQEI